MKKSRHLILPLILLLMVSCTNKEQEKASLLEYEINDQLISFEGFAICYTDYVNNITKDFDWHLYNLGQNSLYIQTYDSTLIKAFFTYPDFQAEYSVELPLGKSKTYKVSAGEFRIVGKEKNDIYGDFHFTMKNESDPLDSLIVKNGYFRLYCEKHDRFFLK